LGLDVSPNLTESMAIKEKRNGSLTVIHEIVVVLEAPDQMAET